MTHFYVYVRSGDLLSYPVGPFPSKAAADVWVDPTRDYVTAHVDGYAWGYEWGVASVDAGVLRRGRFNSRVGCEPDIHVGERLLEPGPGDDNHRDDLGTHEHAVDRFAARSAHGGRSRPVPARPGVD
jgi:hypothetical protein